MILILLLFVDIVPQPVSFLAQMTATRAGVGVFFEIVFILFFYSN